MSLGTYWVLLILPISFILYRLLLLFRASYLSLTSCTWIAIISLILIVSYAERFSWPSPTLHITATFTKNAINHVFANITTIELIKSRTVFHLLLFPQWLISLWHIVEPQKYVNDKELSLWGLWYETWCCLVTGLSENFLLSFWTTSKISTD